MDEKQLLDYACLRFEEEKYDEALEAFVLAYSKGYEREWILENIYACYMAGNEPAFREAYEKQGFDSGVSYESCTLDFIPYKDGEYYIFDKKCAEFCGKFSMVELEHIEPLEALKYVEFSATAVEFDGNWGQYQELLAEAANRKIYAVCHDMQRGMSYWKIPELEKYLTNVRMFSDLDDMQRYFHEHTAVYLPKIVYGENPALSELFDKEHAYRLTPEGRNTDNVLLTIAIPTRNRGYLLHRRLENLMRMTYDAEIEIVVSKNGTQFYEEEYAQCAKIADARVRYYDHGKELKYYENWRSAIEMSYGKYVVLVSDEDDVCIEAMEHYLKLLRDSSKMNIMRVRGTGELVYYNEYVYEEKGLAAFARSFLTNNYVSGYVVKREAFIKENFSKLDVFADNIFYKYYAHEWWTAILCKTGDYMIDPVVLIQTGEPSRAVEMDKGTANEAWRQKNGRILSQYATYQARLEQFLGQYEFLQWYCEGDQQWMMRGLERAIQKLCSLYSLARYHDYDVEHYEYWLGKYIASCVEVIDQIDMAEEQKGLLLERVRGNVEFLLKEDSEKRVANAN